jgi:hypothetical protein
VIVSGRDAAFRKESFQRLRYNLLMGPVRSGSLLLLATVGPQFGVGIAFQLHREAFDGTPYSGGVATGCTPCPWAPGHRQRSGKARR